MLTTQRISPPPCRDVRIHRGAAMLELRTTVDSAMGWILDRFQPALVAAIDVARSRGTGAGRLAALDAGAYAAVFAFGAPRRRRGLDDTLLAQIARVLVDDGALVVGDCVPGRLGRIDSDQDDPSPPMTELCARIEAAGLAIFTRAPRDPEVGRLIVARKTTRRAS
ncbi:MAG TPA: hypothetical protein VM734_26790 [Kofleriaceae bacterium]|nr:hypothetical protein [Kofleriaceae bacterium]